MKKVFVAIAICFATSSFANTPESVRNGMNDVMKADKMVTGYKFIDGLLIVKINNNRPVTDIAHYGFDASYKNSVMKMTGVKQVEFETKVDNNARSVCSALSEKGKKIYGC